MSSVQTESAHQITVRRLQRVTSGKVREIFRVDRQDLLIVATDRISAFDVILPDAIPRKGEVLTQLSAFWFGFLEDMTPTHFITADTTRFPQSLRESENQIVGRSMLVRDAEMIPVECVARGYLAGSGWKDYQQTGGVCGIALPKGLVNGSQLPEPIFTPATKAAEGHDQNISFEQMSAITGADMAHKLRDLTLAVYARASEYARERGIIIADTKFEWGFIEDRLSLCDEALTPDSSRFWPAATWKPGGPQKSFDKQFVRDYLETLDWNKMPPAPHLPADVIARTTEKYLEAYHLLTGAAL